MLKTGAPARVDDWGGLTGEMADAIFRVGYRSTAAVPIVVAGALWGAVAIASEDPLRPDSEDRLVGFCELASLAVASAQARADLIASRARLVRAGDDQRRKLERNLHDGAQQRFVSVVLKLRLARARLTSHPDATADLLEDASRELDTGLRELREIARGLHPAILGEQGLLRALEALAEGLPVPVDIEADADRLPEHIEATAYYIVSEALTNVAKHAAADRARVSVRRDGAVLRCEVSDDGRGGADTTGGTGILGLRDRAEAAGGTLSLVSPPGRGTVVVAVLPAEPTARAASASRKRGDRGRQGGGGEDVVVRGPGQDRQPRGRAQRAVPVGVAQAAAQQPVELDDVRGADRVGIGEDEHGRQLELLHLGRPVVVVLEQLARLGDQHRPVLHAGRQARVALVERGLRQHVGHLRREAVHVLHDLGVRAVAPESDRDEHQASHALRVLDRRAQRHKAPERVAHHVGPGETEVLDEGRDVVGHGLRAQRAVDVGRRAVALQIDRDDPPARRRGRA